MCQRHSRDIQELGLASAFRRIAHVSQANVFFAEVPGWVFMVGSLFGEDERFGLLDVTPLGQQKGFVSLTQNDWTNKNHAPSLYYGALHNGSPILNAQSVIIDCVHESWYACSCPPKPPKIGMRLGLGLVKRDGDM